LISIVIIVSLLAYGAVFVYAAPSGADLTKGSSSSGNASVLASQNGERGNVTQLDMVQVSSTNFWAGFYGTIQGEIILANSAGNRFYNWSDASPTGEVYASRDASVTWASIACVQNPSDVGAEEIALNITTAAIDNITGTFSKVTHTTFTTGGVTFAADLCNYTTNAYDNTGAQATNWDEILLWDTADTVYAALIVQEQTGFDSGTYDFEILVPVNYSATGALTAYSFYLELS